MTPQEAIRMDYELSVGNAERTLERAQATMDNLAELLVPLRNEIEATAQRQMHWVGAVNAVECILLQLSDTMDEAQNHISRSKTAHRKMLQEGAQGNAGKEV